ncbi:MAG TPA: radical SAM family heme chaperone HemW [Caulobacteraceae bacterium]
MTGQSPDIGLYVHWPYCARVCPYCDFNVVRDRGRSATDTNLVAAIVADLEGQAQTLGRRRLVSIFFGGGTPSLAPVEVIAEIICTAQRLWPPAPDLEVTLEANPADATRARFADLAGAGVNRLSLGVQSFDDGQLRFLGRDHDAATALRAAECARSCFQRVSFDLIYALPGQTTSEWAAMLAQANSLGPEHLSAYQLTIEPQTAFGRALRRGEFRPLADDQRADLFDTTQSVLGALGYHAYEVSNHALGEAARSRHNLIYWRGQDYVGVGPGAHGRLTLAGKRCATECPRRIADYIAHVDRFGVGAHPQELTARDAATERLLMGLRTVEGAPLSELDELELGGGRIAALAGYLEVRSGHLIATGRGRPVLDRLIGELTRAA